MLLRSITLQIIPQEAFAFIQSKLFPKFFHLGTILTSITIITSFMESVPQLEHKLRTEELKQHLLKRGYREQEVDSAIQNQSTTNESNHSKLEKKRTTLPSYHPSRSHLPSIPTTHHPTTPTTTTAHQQDEQGCPFALHAL